MDRYSVLDELMYKFRVGDEKEKDVVVVCKADDMDARIQDLEEKVRVNTDGWGKCVDENTILRKALKDIKRHEYSHDIIKMIATEALKEKGGQHE